MYDDKSVRSSKNILSTIICQISDHLRSTQFLMMEKQINLTIVVTFIYLSDLNGCYWMSLWAVQKCFRSFNTWAGVGMSGIQVPMSTVLPIVTHLIFEVLGTHEYRVSAWKKLRVSMGARFHLFSYFRNKFLGTEYNISIHAGRRTLAWKTKKRLFIQYNSFSHTLKSGNKGLFYRLKHLFEPLSSAWMRFFWHVPTLALTWRSKSFQILFIWVNWGLPLVCHASPRPTRMNNRSKFCQFFQ